MIPALAAKELGLGLAVAPVGIATAVTPLGSMPGVHGDDLATESFRLVLQETLELGKAPGVKLALGFPTRGFGAGSDVGEVLHNDCCTGFDAVKGRGGKSVIAIPSETLFAASEASKVALSRLSAFGLQSTSKAKDSFNNFTHMPVAVKAVVRGDGGTCDSQVNADGLPIAGERDIGQTDNDVEAEMPLTINKVGGSRGIANRILGIPGKIEQYPSSAAGGGQVNGAIFPIHLEGMQIKSRRAEGGVGAVSSPSLFFSGNRRPYGFAGLLSCLDMQIGDEAGQGILAVAISQTVKRVGITDMLVPADRADGIERFGKLLNCLLKSFSLFLRRF